MISSAHPVRAAGWEAKADPIYDTLFQRTNDWIGADGDFTVTLTNGLTLWLFSDTFVGEIKDGHRVHVKMINNSAAWQHGLDPASAMVEFFHGTNSDGKPASLITPADGKGWFWLFDGVMDSGKLYLFLSQIEHTSGQSAFGFRHIGTWLGEVSNPLSPPTQWHVHQRKLPFSKLGMGEYTGFGSASLEANGFVYLYGTSERKGEGKKMILARVPQGSLADLANWHFRTADGWSTNADAAADLCGNMASEYSVSWLKGLNQFVLICTENGLSDKIVARTAPNPWGPWSPATVVYQSPDVKWNKGIFCYAAKAHPMLSSQPDELIVTYAANAYELSQAINDARLYWPRFVRLKLDSTSR